MSWTMYTAPSDRDYQEQWMSEPDEEPEEQHAHPYDCQCAQCKAMAAAIGAQNPDGTYFFSDEELLMISLANNQPPPEEEL